jgi:hypothetical protein
MVISILVALLVTISMATQGEGLVPAWEKVQNIFINIYETLGLFLFDSYLSFRTFLRPPVIRSPSQLALCRSTTLLNVQHFRICIPSR